MAGKYQGKYRIPSARLQNWDYGWNAIYYITICTAGREHCFGKIIDRVIELSELGLFAHQFWFEILFHRSLIPINRLFPKIVTGFIKVLTGRQDFMTISCNRIWNSNFKILSLLFSAYIFVLWF